METNLAHYKDRIYKSMLKNGCQEMTCAAKRIKTRTDICANITCRNCASEMINWLVEEYKEPTVDWSKVSVDTRILVSAYGDAWERAYFAEEHNGFACAFNGGKTSWSSGGLSSMWPFAKLAEEDA